MIRRLLLLLLAAGFLRADSEKDAVDLIHSLADALSSGDTASFLDSFDHSMPDYDKLRNNVQGLVSQGDVSCNIEITSNDGDDSERTLTLDWILTLEPKEVSPGSKRWEKKAKCRIRKTGKKWKVVSFEPVDLFAAPV
jgi:murein L,D-transpeptidase YcbB/YkuD